MPPPTPALQLRSGRVDLTTGRFDMGPERAGRLSARELDLLAALVEASPEAVTQETLLRDVWGYKSSSSRTVESTMNRLRGKIEHDPRNPDHLLTVHGEGYRFLPGWAPPRPCPPRAGDRFVGRARERALIEHSLAVGARLVTLHGPGGMGKTRLAAELAAGEQGVVWVEAAGAHDIAALCRAVARSLGVEGEDRPEAIASLLAPQHGLLVLDNLEDAGEGAAPCITAWLQAAPGLRALCTSRTPVGARGERLVPIAPLPPDDATALLRDRATATWPTFAASAEDLAPLLHLLDGSPLAIELCAPWLRSLPPGELAELVRERGELPSSATGDRPDRHSSLGAVLAASWEQLDADTQHALARIAWFEGPVSWAALRAVLGSQAADRVRTLVDRALIRPLDDGRFRLWRPLWLLARDEAAALGIEGDARDRHAAWFASSSPSALLDELAGPRADAARQRWSQQIADRRAAVVHAMGAGRHEQAVAAGVPAVMGLQLSSSLEAARDLAEMLEPQARAPWRGLLLWQLGDILGLTGQPERASETYAEAAACAHEQDDPRLGAHANALHAALLRHQGDRDGARPLAERALILGRQAGDLGAQAMALGELGRLAAAAGDRAGAAERLEAALVLYQRQGHTRREALTRSRLGLNAMAQGRLADAQQAVEAALGQYRALGDSRGEAFARVDLGRVLLRRGAPELARPQLEAGLASHRQLGNAFGASLALAELGLLELDERPHLAWPLLDEGRRAAEAGRWQVQHARCLWGLAILDEREGLADRAAAGFDQARSLLADEPGELAMLERLRTARG